MTEEYEHASIRVEMASDATIRDYFAAKAMQGIITTAAAPVLTSLAGLDDDIAKTAYRMADAMLRAREK